MMIALLLFLFVCGDEEHDGGMMISATIWDKTVSDSQTEIE